jgi:hypothetical protein
LAQLAELLAPAMAAADLSEFAIGMGLALQQTGKVRMRE